MTKTTLTRIIAAASMACSIWAQVPAGTPAANAANGTTQDWPYQIAYATALATGDANINITNTGAVGAGLASGTAATTTGTICVNVYAFSPDEQLISCCSCPVTPNGLKSLSVRRDLTSNTLTPAVPTSVVVKLVASFPTGGATGNCTNSASAPQGTGRTGPVATDILTLPMGMRAWMSTTHGATLAGTAQITEFPFVPATLSGDAGTANAAAVGELGRLKQLCGFNQANGSGFGICASCQLGGLGAGRN